MAAMIASAAAMGRIWLTTYVHNAARTSAVALGVKLFHPRKSAAVLGMESRNMAAMTEPSGLEPSATSSTVRNTKNAANTGASRLTTKFVTKLVRSAATDAIHPMPIAPLGGVAGTPKLGNQLSNWGRVMKTTAQNIHREKPAPNEKLVPPSRRSAIPANTRHSRAAGAASASSSRLISSNIGGLVISCLARRYARKVGRQRCGGCPPKGESPPSARRLNATCPLRDEELDHARDTGDRQQSRRCRKPTHGRSTRRVMNDAAHHRACGPYRGDHVADPVDDVLEGAFWLRPGLSLHRLVELWRRAQVLSERQCLAQAQTQDDSNHQRCP